MLTREGRIDRYDLSDGSRTGSLPVRLAGTVAVIPTPDGLVYVTRGGELARADATDGRLAWHRQLGNMVAPPLIIGRTLWTHGSDVAGGRDRLVAVDLRSGRVQSSTGLPEFGVAGMADVGGDVWLSTPAGKVMVVRP